jgi:hypothetical protein
MKEQLEIIFREIDKLKNDEELIQAKKEIDMYIEKLIEEIIMD